MEIFIIIIIIRPELNFLKFSQNLLHQDNQLRW